MPMLTTRRSPWHFFSFLFFIAFFRPEAKHFAFPLAEKNIYPTGSRFYRIGRNGMSSRRLWNEPQRNVQICPHTQTPDACRQLPPNVMHAENAFDVYATGARSITSWNHPVLSPCRKPHTLFWHCTRRNAADKRCIENVARNDYTDCGHIPFCSGFWVNAKCRYLFYSVTFSTLKRFQNDPVSYWTIAFESFTRTTGGGCNGHDVNMVCAVFSQTRRLFKIYDSRQTSRMGKIFYKMPDP